VTNAIARAATTVAAILLAVVLAGCGDTRPDALTCATPAEGLVVRDAASGMHLCLPPNWRQLEAGDPGWQTVYGDDDSVEQTVRDGSIRLFAVPLEPRETDLFLNLAVYVQPFGPNQTVDQVGRAYEETISRLDPPVTEIVAGTLVLPAGPAYRVSGTRPRGVADRDRFTAYVLLHGDEAFYVIYVTSAVDADRYAEMFLHSANSISFP
jgi:hypothetical protein